MTDTVLDAHVATRAAAKPRAERHFGGPSGAVAMMVLLPLLTIYLWICVHRYGGALVLPSRALLDEVPLPTGRAVLLWLGWLAFQALLDVVLPGRTGHGLKLADGTQLAYCLNGLLSLVVTLAVAGGLLVGGVVRASDVVAQMGPLLTTGILLAYLLGAFLYGYGFTSKRVERRDGNVVYDYFMGSALNPRFGHRFDLKMFCESKIGMTTWIVITLLFAAAQWEREGSISTAMALVCLFQLAYVIDFYVFEEAMLSTWDINYENYGFMLAFAFVVWMPFTFSLQAQYLAYHRPALPIWVVVGLVALNFAGYFLFRTANLQKHRFRTQPGARIWGKEATFLETRRGTRLLTSGWWGMARHVNYLGDLTMALAWCLPCGFAHITPYFYFLYFAPLLIHRERRDHHSCQQKYGADWDRYCARVPYRIVPGIY
jgi:delta14-sterol reductase